MTGQQSAAKCHKNRYTTLTSYQWASPTELNQNCTIYSRLPGRSEHS